MIKMIKKEIEHIKNHRILFSSQNDANLRNNQMEFLGGNKVITEMKNSRIKCQLPIKMP